MTPEITFIAQLTSIFMAIGTTWSQRLEDFCPWETFKATCGKNEVIVMETALYGRMKLGRCINIDLGYIGCSNNVIEESDTMCSGRRQCEIQTPNPIFDNKNQCMGELKSYFTASYRCQQVISADTDMCQTANFVKVKASEGYLSNLVTMTSNCGSVTAPWILEASPGQRINITLLDFAVNSDYQRSYGIGETACLRYATLIEDDPKGNKLVCGGEKREKYIYTSIGNRLEVRIHNNPYAENKQPYFMLKFKVVGCSDPDLPDFAWYKRSDDIATIGCTGGNERWRLICRGTKWTGTMGTCTNGRSQNPGEFGFVLGASKISSTFTIAVIIAISVAIGIMILLTGLYCMRRQKQANERKRLARETELYRELAYSEYNKQSTPDSDLRQVRYHRDSNFQNPRLPSSTNEYASIRDWPLPPPPTDCSTGYEKNQNGSYFRPAGNYPESIGSGSENIYQLPEVSDGSAGEEPCPRYFELDPNNPSKGNNKPYPNTGTGFVMPSKEAHYSN